MNVFFLLTKTLGLRFVFIDDSFVQKSDFEIFTTVTH